MQLFSPPPVGDHDRVRVLFMARQKDSCVGNIYGRTWQWIPSRPANAQLITIPGAEVDGADDVFCSGHAFMPDGSLLVVGGQDYLNHCVTLDPFGHNQTHRLDTSVNPPVWGESADMNRERWYPTALTIDDGNIMVVGHSLGADPGLHEDPLQPPYSYPQLNWETHERFDVGTSAFLPVVTNLADTGFCIDQNMVSVGGYPRLHLLASGNVMRTDAARPLFIDIKSPLACTEPRWRVSTIPTAFGGLGQRHGGNSIHIVYRDESDPPDPIREVIYAVGGTDGDDDAGCGMEDPSVLGSANVEKMIQPGPLVPWTSVAPLNQGRFNHNTAILPTGALLVVGGTAINDPLDGCTPAVNAERYRPPELFPPQDGPGVWVTLDPQANPRSYHSVAGLLPDGRVFSAGGRDPDHSWHTVEVYSPQYVFCSRPIITAWPDPTPAVGAMSVPYSSTFTVNVTLGDSLSVIERIVLIRNGAATHAQDMNQRYVVLSTDPPSGISPSLSVDVHAPSNGRIAPPGYYLLYVVERRDGPGQPKILPSEGKWVRLE